MTKTMTIIESNGSKLAGEKPDTIEQLIEVLKNHRLDISSFGSFGFIKFEEDNGYSARDYDMRNVSIHGNFIDISHVFRITGVYRTLYPLIEAIEENLKRQSLLINERN